MTFFNKVDESILFCNGWYVLDVLSIATGIKYRLNEHLSYVIGNWELLMKTRLIMGNLSDAEPYHLFLGMIMMKFKKKIGYKYT